MSTHEVEQLIFSIVPSILTFDFNLISGSFLLFWGPNVLFLRLGRVRHPQNSLDPVCACAAAAHKFAQLSLRPAGSSLLVYNLSLCNKYMQPIRSYSVTVVMAAAWVCTLSPYKEKPTSKTTMTKKEEEKSR